MRDEKDEHSVLKWEEAYEFIMFSEPQIVRSREGGESEEGKGRNGGGRGRVVNILNMKHGQSLCTVDVVQQKNK